MIDRKRDILGEALGWLVIAFVMTLILAVLMGCASVKGGEAIKSDTDNQTIVDLPGGVHIEMRGQQTLAATTQPSASGLFKAFPNIRGSDAGELGSLRWEVVKANTGNIILGVILLGCAAASAFFLRNYLLAALCAAAAVLSFLFPLWLGLIALAGMLAIIWWKYHDVIGQLGKGTIAAIAAAPSTHRDLVALAAASKHDAATKEFIRG